MEENHGIDRGLPVVQSDDRHGAARPDKIDGALDQGRRSGALEHEVELASAESITSIVRLNDLDAELGSALAAERREVVTEHRVDTACAKAPARHKARSSQGRTRTPTVLPSHPSDGRSEQRRRAARPRRPPPTKAAPGGRERLTPRRAFGNSESVGERAGDAEADARLVHVLAEMSKPFATSAAVAARLDRDTGDTRPDDDPFHLRSPLQ